MKNITTNTEYDALIENKSDFVLFKNSPTCSISGGACKEVYKAIDALDIQDIYMIDVLNSGDLKYYVADQTGIQHESPQILIFKSGKLKVQASHTTITQERIQNNI